MKSRKWYICFQNPFLLALHLGLPSSLSPSQAHCHWLVRPSSQSPHPACQFQILPSVMNKVQFCLRAYFEMQVQQNPLSLGSYSGKNCSSPQAAHSPISFKHVQVLFLRGQMKKFFSISSNLYNFYYLEKNTFSKKLDNVCESVMYVIP